VVIYDRHYSPFLLNQDGARYVSAESVYAVFEVKQELNATYLQSAMKKAASVRRLRRTSAPVPYAAGTYKPKKPPRILAGILALASSWTPPLGASLYSMVKGPTAEESLDLGCALRHGAFEVLYPPRRRPSIRTSSSETALIFFFLRLLGRLQQSGTVPALDFEAYGRTL